MNKQIKGKSLSGSEFQNFLDTVTEEEWRQALAAEDIKKKESKKIRNY